jgi:hypothetical protein
MKFPVFSSTCNDLTVVNGIQEVVGSIPISSTISFQALVSHEKFLPTA